MSFVYWVFQDEHCFVFPHNAGYVGVSENPKHRWYRRRDIKKAPKAKLVILYEGTREECLKREYQLRPSQRIGWNIAQGGMAVEPQKHGKLIREGMQAAKARGVRLGRRPTVTNDTAKVRAIRSDHKAGKSLREIAKAHGVGHMTVARITAEVAS